MNYTEELRKILFEYTKTFKTHLFFETESIFVKLVLEDKSEPKYKFEIINKTNNSKSKSENPFKIGSRKFTNRYLGYLNKKDIHARDIDKKMFVDLSRQSMTILNEIQPTRTALPHRHP